MSERRVCRVIGQPRSSQRQEPRVRDDEERLRNEIIDIVKDFGRYGYRRVTDQLHKKGWRVNHKRVERIWWQEGLKVPQKQRKRGRLWLNDGSCIRMRPERKNHVWTYDFVSDRTSDGRALRYLTILDEYTRESLKIHVDRKITAYNVVEQLAELFVERGIPDFIRSDNGPEFTAKVVREWLARLGVKTLFIEPGSPWENGYIESFNGKFRDEFLNGEIFDTVLEARILTERWRQQYNTIRPHSSLGYRPPAPETIYLYQGNQLALRKDFTNFQVGT
jgi:putative transposase